MTPPRDYPSSPELWEEQDAISNGRVEQLRVFSFCFFLAAIGLALLWWAW